jgi:tRNA-splicing ligase RtcB
MAKQKFTQSDFHQIGIYDLELIRRLGRSGKKLLKSGEFSKEELLQIFRRMFENPKGFKHPHIMLQSLAEKIRELSFEVKRIEPASKAEIPETTILKSPGYYKVFGREQIDDEALVQMDVAMRLPVSKAGALMPDAHVGYGLPIGGVLATNSNVVIPYAVGVDIACRMCMSVFDIREKEFEKFRRPFTQSLIDQTVFGVGAETKSHLETDLFDRKEWQFTRTVRELKNLAYSQHGTSGAGNHFVEWGFLKVRKEDEILNLPKGDYVALLSHSGSRGFGAQVAKIYSDIAQQKRNLPNQAKHLSWLDLDSEEGQEYWLAMNLAGMYASDNHHEIHKKIIRQLNLDSIQMVENHHNFAWKEKLDDGTEVIVHRKGATPAGKDNIGIIPGSMTQHGFIVRGKGEPSSLNSASHGAGRLLSRKKAVKTISQKDLKIMIELAGIELIGGHVDEAPKVYKNIDQVMENQKNLVDILAEFTPRIVRMAEPERWRKVQME